jgi:hypothetical protein
MSEERARRIIRALGWRKSDFQRELNRVARTNYKSGDVWKWFAEGKRQIPLAAAVFLRMQVRLAVLKRRLQQGGKSPKLSDAVSVAINELRELAYALECGAAELLDVEFGGEGDRSRLAVDYRLLGAPRERVLMH